MESSFLSKVVAALDLLPMIWLGEGLLQLLGERPNWAAEEFDCFAAPNKPIHAETISPFLENFLVDATAFWQSDESKPLRSGAWTASGKTGRGLQLEAIALKIDSHPVLLVESLEIGNADKFQWLQKARQEQLDIEAERKLANHQLISARFYDALTGLPNRDFFLAQLERAYEAYKEDPRRPFSLAVINLDHFQRVNNSLGNVAGDQVLIKVARRIQACLRSPDLLTRYSSDEFCLLLHDSTEQRAVQVVKRTLAAIHQPLLADQRSINISASAGICQTEPWYHNSRDILRDASLALNQAKTQGKSQYAVFDRRMRTRAFELWNLENALEYAIERNELQLWYQPIVNARSRCVESFEALIRWHHPEYGRISPGKFIPLAEKSGLVLKIDDWVLTQVCQTLKKWQTAGKTNVHVNVNISARHFTEGTLFSAVKDAIAAYNISPHSIRLELTESSLLADTDTAVETLKQIKSLGLEVAIDDFGTGYASLGYLQALPLDQLKIDGYFVEMMSTNGPTIVNTIIELAHDLGYGVTAERVETVEQYETLRQLGCDTLQGYLFSKAIPAMDAQNLIGSEVIISH